jgi:hypothetical protein
VSDVLRAQQHASPPAPPAGMLAAVLGLAAAVVTVHSAMTHDHIGTSW